MVTFVSAPVSFARVAAFACCALLTSGLFADARSSPNRLADVRSRDTLTCGVWPNVEGFATRHGQVYAGFDVDFCHAIAAAIFGDPTKVKFVALERIEQFRRRNDIDLVTRRLTWTLSREEASGMVFGPVIFYDGQGFLVPKSNGISDPAQLSNKSICVIDQEHYPRTLWDYFTDSGRQIRLVLVQSDQEAEEALRANRCDAYSADVSWLAAARGGFLDGLTRYDILTQVISKEPLAPMMRAKDVDLVRLVRWTVFAMIEAEELGLTSQNINTTMPGKSAVRRFLGIHPRGEVALPAGDWVRAIVAGVGNYGEVFDRNLGTNSTIKLDRGPNRLWINGGLMYAPPLDH